jgi:hypothetical protein
MKAIVLLAAAKILLDDLGFALLLKLDICLPQTILVPRQLGLFQLSGCYLVAYDFSFATSSSKLQSLQVFSAERYLGS